MIDKLLQIQKFNLLSSKNLNHFNATLPILIEVLKKTKTNHYLLMVGNKTLETKSFKALEVGGKYFALMKHLSTGGIMLTSLKAEPKIPKAPLKFDFEELKKNFLDVSRIDQLQEYALDKISQAQNKEDFLSWGFFLLGMQRRILSFWIDQDSKNTFFQIKAQKREMSFYALFPHLGELNGKLYQNQGITLELCVSYESVASFLKEHQKLLKGIDRLEVCVDQRISPLFLPSEQLLDLKI